MTERQQLTKEEVDKILDENLHIAKPCELCGLNKNTTYLCGGPYSILCGHCRITYIKIIHAYLNHLRVTGFAVYRKKGFRKKVLNPENHFYPSVVPEESKEK